MSDEAQSTETGKTHQIRHTGTYVLPMAVGSSRKSVEAFGTRAAEAWGLDAGDPLDLLIQNFGGKVRTFDPMNGSTHASVVQVNPDETMQIDVSTYRSGARQRVDLAWAMAHRILHYPAVKAAHPDLPMRVPYSTGQEDDPDFKQAIYEANWFIWGMLMPEMAFRAEWDKQGGDVTAIARTFHVPSKLVGFRATGLDLTAPQLEVDGVSADQSPEEVLDTASRGPALAL